MKYAGQRQGPTNHMLGFGIVVLLHVVTAYALMSGLARKVVEVVKGPLETKIIEEAPKEAEQDTPPPPPPKLAPPPPPYIPPPEVNIMLPAATNAGPAITAVTTTKPVEAPPPPPAPVAAPRPAVRVAPVVSAASCQKPVYPAASKRLEEEGTVVLRFLIDTDGQVIDSQVQTSSGFDRLDQAARSALSKCKFKPGSVDGQPEQSWASMKYTWRLED